MATATGFVQACRRIAMATGKATVVGGGIGAIGAPVTAGFSVAAGGILGGLTGYGLAVLNEIRNYALGPGDDTFVKQAFDKLGQSDRDAVLKVISLMKEQH